MKSKHHLKSVSRICHQTDVLRWHVLHDAVEQIKPLVVIGLGCDEFLEHSKKTRLEKKVVDRAYYTEGITQRHLKPMDQRDYYLISS